MYIRIYKMKRKIWRAGNSLVITIPSDIVERLKLMEKKLIDFDIKNVFDETEKIFDNLLGDKMFKNLEEQKDNFRRPLTDLRETNNDFIATVEIPGVDKKDIQLNISEISLEIKVEKKSEMKIAENNGFIRSERFFSNFYRSMNLPLKIIPEKARANYKNGILEVILPKAQFSNNKRKISIE